MTADLFFVLAQAAAPKPPAPPDQGLGMLVWMGFAFVLVYFLTIRPQRKKQLELENQVKSLKTGDRVVTTGGIHGVVANAKGDTSTTLTLKIADNVKIEIEKTAVGTILRDKSESETKAS